MSKAGERLIRSMQEALDFVKNGGEGTECIVIPPDMPKAERMRLIQEILDGEDEGLDGEDHTQAPIAAGQSIGSTGSGPGSAQRRVAASGRSR